MTADDSSRIKDFEQFVREHGDLVLRYAYLFLGDRGWAEDASQEVFLKAYQSKEGFRGEASPKTWLLRVTVNTCKNIYKSKGYRKAKAECSLEALSRQQQECTVLEAEEKDLWVEVLHLPIRLRDVVLLKYYYGYDSGEIGKLLGITPSAARMRLSRGIQTLRKIMGERMMEHERPADTTTS